MNSRLRRPLILCVSISCVMVLALDAPLHGRGGGGGGRGGGGGGGGGGMSRGGGGGGGARPSMGGGGRSPSASRPNVSRPTGGPKPNSRPSMSNMASKPGNKPGNVNRPSMGGVSRPTPGGPSTRPGTGNMAGTRPGGSPNNRPSTLPGTRPSTRPGVGGGNAGNIGATRPVSEVATQATFAHAPRSRRSNAGNIATRPVAEVATQATRVLVSAEATRDIAQRVLVVEPIDPAHYLVGQVLAVPWEISPARAAQIDRALETLRAIVRHSPVARLHDRVPDPVSAIGQALVIGQASATVPALVATARSRYPVPSRIALVRVIGRVSATVPALVATAVTLPGTLPNRPGPGDRPGVGNRPGLVATVRSRYLVRFRTVLVIDRVSVIVPGMVVTVPSRYLVRFRTVLATDPSLAAIVRVAVGATAMAGAIGRVVVASTSAMATTSATTGTTTTGTITTGTTTTSGWEAVTAGEVMAVGASVPDMATGVISGSTTASTIITMVGTTGPGVAIGATIGIRRLCSERLRGDSPPRCRRGDTTTRIRIRTLTM